MGRIPLWVQVAGVAVVAAALRFYDLGGLPLWLDEASTWAEIQRPYSAIEKDVHPPLYYYLQRAWLFGVPRLGLPGAAPSDSEFWLRAPSAAAGVLTVPLVVLLGRALGAPSAGLLAALLFAIGPFQVRYGQEAKAYALMTLAAVAVMWAVAQLLTRRQPDPESGGAIAARWLPWAVYVVATTAVLYCHNTGLFVPAAANGVVLTALAAGLAHKGLPGRWLVAQAAVLLLWLPWLPSLLSQSRDVLDGYWIPAPTFERIVYSVRELLWNAELLLVADLFVAGLAAWGLARWKRSLLPALVAGGFFFLPVVGQLVVSLAVQPVFLTRTLIWTAVPLYLLVAHGALSLGPRPARVAAVLALLLCSAVSLSAYFGGFQKEAWDEAAAYAAQVNGARPPKVILVDRAFTVPAFDYYFRHHSTDIPLVGLDDPAHFEDQIRAVGPGRVVLIYSHTDGDSTSADILDRRGRMIDGRRFYGVAVLLYDLR